MRLRHVLFGVCVAGLVGGCGILFDFGDYDTSAPPLGDDEGGGGGMTDAAGSLQIDTLASLTVRRTFPATLNVSIERNGVEGAIHLTVTGSPTGGPLPDGVTIDPVDIAAGATTGVLTINSSETADLGVSSVFVNAEVAGTPQVQAPLTLTLTASRLDPSFGEGGVLFGGPFEMLQDFDLDDAGRPLVSVVAPPGGGLTRDRLIIYRVETDGGYGPIRTIPQANSGGYRTAVAPSGDFLIYDSNGGRVDSYPAAGGGGTSIGVLPDLGDVEPTCMRLTRDGRVIVLADGTLGTRNAAVVASYFADAGGPDLTFGGDGGVVFSGDEDDYGGDLLATDAGLVTCITRSLTPTSKASVLVLVRLAADGTADRSFADGGLTIARASAALTCTAIAADGAGFIVAGELDSTDPTADSYGFLMRVDANGAVDLSLGDAGIVTHAAQTTTTSVAVDADGGILSAGLTGVRLAAKAAAFADLPDAAPNLLFGLGSGGVFPLTMVGATSEATAIRVLPDGSLLVAGTAEVNGAATWFVARILP